MHCIRRSFQAAARKPLNVPCALAQGHGRAFSRSAACARGTLPTFAESSSPDLSSLLATYTAKVLLPLHLNKDQQKLVYKKANQARLEADPVEVTFGDVTLPLEHLDRNLLPARWQYFRRIVLSSRTRDDWTNVIRLLEGLENAGIRVPSGRQSMAVRHLCLSGMHTLLVQALQRVRVTGLHLTDQSVLLQVLRGLHDKAALSDWDKEETTQALRMAKQVVDLMEEKEHHASLRGDPPTDPRRDPTVIALLTELTAVLARRHGGDTKELQKLVRRLVNVLIQTNYRYNLKKLADSNVDILGGLGERVCALGRFFTNGGKLISLLITWHALHTSRVVLGADMPMAKEAYALEDRAERVLTRGLYFLCEMAVQDDGAREASFVAYAKDAAFRCRPEDTDEEVREDKKAGSKNKGHQDKKVVSENKGEQDKIA